MNHKMTHEQIDEINGLISDHAEALTAFYDEGLSIGRGQGCLVGVLISICLFGGGLVYKHYVAHKKKKDEKES